jgi:hypothetical protein
MGTTDGTSPQPITFRGAVTLCGAVVAVLVGIATLHANMIVPGIVREAVTEASVYTDKRLAEHQSTTHERSVSYRELELVLARLDDLKGSVTARLENIERAIGQ